MPSNKKISFKTRIIANFSLFFSRPQLKTTIILLYATVAMVCWKTMVFPETLFVSLLEKNEIAAVIVFLLASYKILGSLVLFGVIPIFLIKVVFREHLSDYGFRLGNLKRGIGFFLIAAPFVVWFAYLAGTNPKFLSVYPYNPLLDDFRHLFLLHAILYLGYYFGWEFFFRGFIQNGLRRPFGIGNAILIQMLASTLLHFGHPPSEIFASIGAGLFWGIISYRTRSILSAFFQHALLGIVLDWFLIQIEGR